MKEGVDRFAANQNNRLNGKQHRVTKVVGALSARRSSPRDINRTILSDERSSVQDI